MSMEKHVTCHICGETPITSHEAADGAVLWSCPNHLEGEALLLYDELREEGWDAPPRKTVH